MRVYYLGPKGSYSYILLSQVFAGKEAELVACNNFDQIVELTAKDVDSVGLLPFENSITSSVHDNIDSIFNNSLKVVGESQLHVKVNLLGLIGAELKDIKTVYSHPKAIEQASKFLNQSGLEAIPLDSTSAAKNFVIKSADITKGFLGSERLADKKVCVIKGNVTNEENNYTRFVFVSSKDVDIFGKPKEKMMVKFNVKHEPASLAKVLTALGDIGVNLTKIESRPIPGTDWEYGFLVELEYPNASKVEEVLAKVTSEYHILGSYPKGAKFEG